MNISTSPFLRALSVVLFVLVAPSLFGSRYSPPSITCDGNMRVYRGAIELSDMDGDVRFSSRHGSKELDLSLLLEKGYLKSEPSVPKGCTYYLADFKANKSFAIICRVHGLGRSSRGDGKRQSPREEFAELCRRQGVNPAAFRFDLSQEASEDISGPHWLITVANVWYIWLAVFLLPYVFVARPRLAGAGWLTHGYALGSSLIAGLLVLTLFNIHYVDQPIPFWRRYSYGSYPAGIAALAGVTFIALSAWWLVSIVALGVLYRDKCSLWVPLVYLLVGPIVLFLGEKATMPLPLLVPLFGVYLSWAMRNFEISGEARS